MPRLPITKTPKCYVGGAFIRSESNRTYEIADASGAFFANVPLCTRKDVRNAVEAAAKAGAGWAQRSGYNRGQILYRMAEMLEARSSELVDAHFPANAAEKKQAAAEVTATIDRIVHYAGWTDKYESLLGSVNPVASSHFNFSVTEPMGVIAVSAPDEAPLLALISMILPIITSGNAVIALASETKPYPAILLGEMLATSDLPGGVINLITGKNADILPTFATHEHIRAVSAYATPEERKTLQTGAAESVKRTKLIPAEKPYDWFSDQAQGLYHIRDFIELKTTWHPVG
ncbi:MAG: aldehyde dehydrogenase family protein [Akkermansiaceae bacterium]|jgi:acyl-CoA reductase-like NAD-dependent aldehyde dehydrogenase|nr:aldehyde dehydrogenase family protein [Akkermansiaceae bacterium]MDP4646198.1 aldehyde dehydrogenase family protein [Akkermansiaceae bacterium]MDP4779096.1 aldehyde dehydrogenase family protein [Akkermansiaceae bacterium]MDP4848251.1 aldehyde dehydrogenase family protein [Akkermansiaceae bacterium]MDP4896177.1 aldehyde dehydrogenase family protein [Akkermansiaceae bacterium]